MNRAASVMQMHYEVTRSTNFLHQGMLIKQPFVLPVWAILMSSRARALTLSLSGRPLKLVSAKPIGVLPFKRTQRAAAFLVLHPVRPGDTKSLRLLTSPDRYTEHEPVCDCFTFYNYCSNSYSHHSGNNRGFVNGLWLFMLYRQSKKEGEKFNHFSSNLYKTATAYNETTNTITT